MTDVESRVRRAAAAFDLRPDLRPLYESVEERLGHSPRGSRARLRTLAVAALALAVAGAGVLFLTETLGGVEPAPPATAARGEGPLPMWPVQTQEDAEEAQRASDMGHGPDMTDPWNVARLFAQTVLPGSEWRTNPEGPESPCGTSTSPPGCDEVAPTRTRITLTSDRSPASIVYVHLAKLVRTDERGIWLVTEVRSPDLALPFESGQTVEWRSIHGDVPIGIDPEGLFLHVMSGDCNYAAALGTRNGAISFSVGPQPSLDVREDVCAPATPALLVVYAMESRRGGGRPVLDTPLESPIVLFAAVPIRISPENGADTAGFEAVWPESSSEQVLAAQERADTGDPAMQWRLDPEEVARRAVATFALNREVILVHESRAWVADGRLFVVRIEGPENHMVLVRQLAREGEGGIWTVSSIHSRLEIAHVTVESDGTTTALGRGAIPGVELGWHIHRCDEPDPSGCAYTLELRTVRASADGTFVIRSGPERIDHPGVLTVWEIHDTSEESRWGPVLLRWLPAGPFSDS